MALFEDETEMDSENRKRLKISGNDNTKWKALVL